MQPSTVLAGYGNLSLSVLREELIALTPEERNYRSGIDGFCTSVSPARRGKQASPVSARTENDVDSGGHTEND